MSDWHRKLVEELVRETPSGSVPPDAATLEIDFGRARSAMAYALELARAHRIASSGDVSGDSIWLQLGDGRVRFTLNRREGHVLVERPGQDPVRVASGGGGDLAQIAHDAIDALVAAFRELPASSKRPAGPPPGADDEEDEPTRA